VVIDQIDIRGVALLETENDAPVGTDGDAPITRELAFQRVQPKARQIELLRACRHIEPGQHARNLICMLRVHLAPVVVFVKAAQAAMSKATDHNERI
jgi:hypothetical protein